MINRILLCVFVVLLSSFAIAEDNLPQSTDPRVVIELFAEQPQVVTPTGLAVDRTGRVFVAESHTHFRPDDYDGPKADRILILEDTTGDGRADRKTVFHEGFTHIMDLEFHHDGALYVATRKDIHRMRDTTGDNKADEITRIVNLETEGNYPHNGLSGLAFHLDGRLTFGLGENLGADYALVGTDGKRFTGGGEGGSTYQVHADGTNLRRVSTGWWNPFGMCVDAFDRVFGTDNDPNAAPPCRLIQVIEGGDYGYEYRYGRSGLHPLISWTGSNPGNLPMIAGTGEAPCAVLTYESDALPREYLGRLLVATWADHRIEHYKIEQPKNQGLVTTKREVLIEGHGEFRPVDLSLAPDGSVYVSDWVSSSYTLHKQGRIWRIRPKDMGKPQRPEEPEKALLSLHRPDREQAARQLVAKMTAKDSLKAMLAKYEDPRVRSVLMKAWAARKELKLEGLNTWLQQEPDVRLQQLGVRLLGEHGLKVDFRKWESEPELSVKAEAIISGAVPLSGREYEAWVKKPDPMLFHAIVMGIASKNIDEESLSRTLSAYMRDFEHPELTHGVGLLVERRRGYDKLEKRHHTLIQYALNNGGDAWFLAVKWIADERIQKFRSQIEEELESPRLDYRNFRAVAAAIDRLDGKPPADHPAPEFLLDRITAKDPSANLLKLSLREIDPGFKKLELGHLSALISHEDADVRLEAIRTLASHPDGKRFEHLIASAEDEKAQTEHRAAAIAGLAGGPPETLEVLLKHATGEEPLLRDEALRSLVGVDLNQEQREKLAAAGEDSLAVQRLLAGSVGPRPDVQDLVSWKVLLEGEGDLKAGERIFFGAKVGTCSRCHQIDGRGTAVGPDLTQIARRLESQGEQPTEWLLKTILRPSEDMAPEYTPWIIVTKDGKTLTGLPRRKGGNSEAYLGIDGKEFTVRKPDIEFHRESNTSLMPAELLQNLTDQEIRDLFAFLRQTR